MSRIGNNPINISSDVNFSYKQNLVKISGKLGELEVKINGNFDIKKDNDKIIVSRKDETKDSKSKHGLYRMLIHNMIIGVTQGYNKSLELVGVGYSAKLVSNFIELNLGYSHLIYFELPTEIKCKIETVKGKPPTIHLSSIDKQLLGLVASKIRQLRKPEPYKGKGVKFVGEILRRKAGKTSTK